ncbi:MAG: DUF445 family protein [Clostridiales bacterium]|nr:DUF445 family protein [Clostridiales bacterium]
MFELSVMTAVGALIGWFTNFLAIKMLFRPIRPWRLPFTKVEIQGLIPKRREEISSTIGETVERELFSMKDIISRLIEGENRLELIRTIRASIMSAIEERIPSFIPRGIKEAILSKVRDVVTDEVNKFVDTSMDDLIEQAIQKIDISSMVEERINSMELEEVEQLTLEVASRELKYIEYLGGILGGLIGLVQGLLLILMRNFS